MADLPDLKSKLTDVEIASNADLTTNLHERFGGNINRLLDESADQRSRLDDKNVFRFSRGVPLTNFQGTFFQVFGNSVQNASSNSITPLTNVVFLFVSGSFERQSGEIEIRIERNGSPIKTINIDETILPIHTSDAIPGSIGTPPQAGSQFQPTFNLMNLSLIDTSANAGVSNTYDLITDTTSPGGSGFMSFQAIQLIGRT